MHFDDFEIFMVARLGKIGPELEADTATSCQDSRSASAYASMCDHLSFLNYEERVPSTSGRQQNPKQKRKRKQGSGLPKQVTQSNITQNRSARKAKQRSKCQSRSKDRRGKQLQRQDYWLTPEAEPDAATSSDDSKEDMDRLYSLENWVEIARFRFRVRVFNSGGYFLMVNPKSETAVLQRYESEEGYTCDTCSYRNQKFSDDGRDEKMVSLFGLELIHGRSLRESHIVPCKAMYQRARLGTDPDMHLRTIKEGDKHFQAVSTLYAVYRFFYTQVMGDALRMRQWSCRMWDARSLKGIVRLQALYRGWASRKRVGYVHCPHCELGRRFLELQWKRWSDISHESRM